MRATSCSKERSWVLSNQDCHVAKQRDVDPCVGRRPSDWAGWLGAMLATPSSYFCGQIRNFSPVVFA